MERIDRLLEQLRSPNKNKRYEACEYLRVAPDLPRLALDALQHATYDPEPEVADAARDAIASHTEPSPLALSSADHFKLEDSRVTGWTARILWLSKAISEKQRMPGMIAAIISCLGVVAFVQLSLPDILGYRLKLGTLLFWSLCGAVCAAAFGLQSWDYAAARAPIGSRKLTALSIIFGLLIGILAAAFALAVLLEWTWHQ